MSSTAGQQLFAAWLTGCETIEEVFMPIGIKRRDKSRHRTQPAEAEVVIVTLFDELTASYTDRKTQLRILCGSV